MKATVTKSAPWLQWLQRLITFAVLTLVAGAWLATPAVAQRGATRPRVQMPKGPVREIIRKNCTSCHGIDDYAFFSLDRAGWQKLVETKHKPGDAPISNQDMSLLLDWMVSKFGPETKAFPRSYVAPEITTFFSDPEARRLLDRACTTCHDTDRINQTRRTADGWRVLAVDMRERGAQLTDEELERLVEWLGRVKGTNESQ
jgi:cytochrome c5